MVRKKLYTFFALVVLTALVIASCKPENVPEVDPTTLPIASFSVDDIKYVQHLEEGGNGVGYWTTYAYVTVKNNSSCSNRWKWQRPGSRELIKLIKDDAIISIYRPVEFMTNKDTAVTQVYLATDEEQTFKITLTAYSDNPIGLNPDSTVLYKTFESHPVTWEVKVKKPEGE